MVVSDGDQCLEMKTDQRDPDEYYLERQILLCDLHSTTCLFNIYLSYQY